MDIQSLSSSAFTGMATPQPRNIAPDQVATSLSTKAASSQIDSSPNASISAVSKDELNSAVTATRDFVGSINSSLEFSIDEDTGTSVVKIMDKETKELIRQIPSEEMLAIAKALDTIKGLLFHQKA